MMGPRAPEGERNPNQGCTEQYQEPKKSDGRFLETVSSWQQKNKMGRSLGDKDAKVKNQISSPGERSKLRRGKSVGTVTVFHYYHHSPLWNYVFWKPEFFGF